MSPSYAVARLYLMLEALCNGEIRPSPAELDWAADLLDTLDLPDEVLEEAEADHYKMLTPA
jgi:hypothetical protein